MSPRGRGSRGAESAGGRGGRGAKGWRGGREGKSWQIRTPEELLAAAIGRLDMFGACSAIHALAKNKADMSHIENKLKTEWTTVVKYIESNSSNISARQISMLIWSFGRLGMSLISCEFLEILLNQATTVMIEVDVIGLSNLLWGVASIQGQCSQTLDGIEHVLKCCQPRARQLCESMDSQAIANIMWAFAKLNAKVGDDFLRVMADCVSARLAQSKSAFNSQELVNTVWAFATLAWTPTPNFLQLIEQSAIAIAASPGFSPQGTANLMWALAKFGQAVSEALQQAMAESALRHTAEFTNQGLVNTLWGFAKLGVPVETKVLRALTGQVRARVDELEARDVASIIWALPTLDDTCTKRDPGLDRLIIQRGRDIVSEFRGHDLLNMLWGMAKGAFADTNFDRFWAEAIARRVYTVSLCPSRTSSGANSDQIKSNKHSGEDDLTPSQLAFLAWSLAKLQLGSPATTIALSKRLTPVLLDLEEQMVGVVAWAVPRLSLCPQSTNREDDEEGKIPGKEEMKQTMKAFFKQLRQSLKSPVGKTLSWKSIAHIEFGLSVHPSLSSAPKMLSILNERAAAVVRDVAGASSRYHKHALKTFLDLSPHPLASLATHKGTPSVLLVDNCKSTKIKKLMPLGELKRWSRFAGSSDHLATALPPKGLHHACILRLPFDQASQQFAFAAIASCLSAGVPVWVYGYAAEGILALKSNNVLPSCLSTPRILSKGGVASSKCETGDGAAKHSPKAYVVELTRLEDAAVSTRGDLSSWWSKTEWTMEGTRTRVSWYVLPGLFAGGGLDIMTKVLLGSLPVPPTGRGIKMLDFACGSGTIGYTLLSRSPSSQVDLLDADSLAIAAAKKNVPGANRVYLSDGWTEVDDDAMYDWIVSNPPVHSGVPDDFSVVQALVKGANSHLKPHGLLFMVAQEYVPIGRIAILHGSFTSVDIHWSDGRFNVWVCSNAQPDPEAPLQSRHV